MDRSEQPEIRGKRLVGDSLVLAVFLEVVQMEGSVVSMLLTMNRFALALAVKVAGLTLILLPLVIYVRLNGLAALKYSWGRVTAIALIVAINLAFGVQYLMSLFR